MLPLFLLPLPSLYPFFSFSLPFLYPFSSLLDPLPICCCCCCCLVGVCGCLGERSGVSQLPLLTAQGTTDILQTHQSIFMPSTAANSTNCIAPQSHTNKQNKKEQKEEEEQEEEEQKLICLSSSLSQESHITPHQRPAAAAAAAAAATTQSCSSVCCLSGLFLLLVSRFPPSSPLLPLSVSFFHFPLFFCLFVLPRHE